MDVVTDVIRRFRDAVLEESHGVLLDIGATPQDAELYSKHGGTLTHVVCLHHSVAAVRRILDYAPSRPVVCAFPIDMASGDAPSHLLATLAGREQATNVAFWRLDMVRDFPRVVRTLAEHMAEGGTLYVYHIDRSIARQRAIERHITMLDSERVRMPSGEVRSLPSVTVAEIEITVLYI